MKILTILITLLLTGPVLDAQAGEGLTALSLVSTKGDPIGRGKTTTLSSLEAQFSIKETGKGIELFVETDDEYWILRFTAPNGTQFEPAIYTHAGRLPYDKYPGLSISGCGRRCNRSSGDFEVLEVKYGVDGKVESFAANFVQRCAEGLAPPLYGSIRYNSAIGLEPFFSDRQIE